MNAGSEAVVRTFREFLGERINCKIKLEEIWVASTIKAQRGNFTALEVASFYRDINILYLYNFRSQFTWNLRRNSTSSSSTSFKFLDKYAICTVVVSKRT